MSAENWNSIHAEDRQAVIEAYKSGNRRLFELSCTSFQLNHNDIQILCQQKIASDIETEYNALKFSSRQKMKKIYIEYTSESFDEQSFIAKLQNVFDCVNSGNVTVIANLINNDESGLYPHATAYANRENTNKPKKSMRKELLDLYPTRLTQANAKLIIKVLYQIQEEIDKKIDNYKNLLLNEIQFRIDINAWLNGFDKKFKACLIKAHKVTNIETLINETSGGNKDRFISYRCDDMLKCEIILKKLKQQCELNLSKVQHRACDLNAATLNDGVLVIKVTPFAFGTRTPTTIFMEYNFLSIRVKNKLKKVSQLINTLSGIDVTEYIGNISKEERSKKTEKRKKKNAQALALKRKNAKNKSKNNTDERNEIKSSIENNAMEEVHEIKSENNSMDICNEDTGNNNCNDIEMVAKQRRNENTNEYYHMEPEIFLYRAPNVFSSIMKNKILGYIKKETSIVRLWRPVPAYVAYIIMAYYCDENR